MEIKTTSAPAENEDEDDNGRENQSESRSERDGHDEEIELKLPGIAEMGSMDTSPATGEGADVGSDLAGRQGGQLLKQ